MSKDDATANSRPHAGNVAIVTATAERLGIVPPEIKRYTTNHTIDSETGYLECNGYASAFDAARKTQFLNVYRANGLAIYKTCKLLNLSIHTVNNAVKIDAAF